MSIYICEKCGVIENTALGGYWKNCRNNEPKMCSECNTGKWHNEFPKKYWNEYGIEKLLEMESHNNGSVINAKKYLTDNNYLPRNIPFSKIKKEGDKNGE